jgi:hypothetical protein
LNYSPHRKHLLNKVDDGVQRETPNRTNHFGYQIVQQMITMIVSSYSFTLNTYFGAHVNSSCTPVNYMLVFTQKILYYLQEPKGGEDTGGRELPNPNLNPNQGKLRLVSNF